MKIMDILPNGLAVKNAVYSEIIRAENDNSVMVISDPLLSDLDTFIRLNNCELDGFLTSDEMTIANTILGMARGCSGYRPSQFIIALASHILVKAESVKCSVQVLPVSLTVQPTFA